MIRATILRHCVVVIIITTYYYSIVAVYGLSPWNEPRGQSLSLRQQRQDRQRNHVQSLRTSSTNTNNPHKAENRNHLVNNNVWWPIIDGRKYHCAILAATAGLGWILSTTTDPAWATTTTSIAGYSNTAAQIHLNSLPPTTISVQIDDLPVIGNLLSGTYSKVLDGDSEDGSIITARSGRADTGSDRVITIRSPSDKVGAIANIASAGHLEFDLDGVVATHVNIDVAASKEGIATIKVDSPLIPRLPFRNAASGLVPPAARTLKLAKKQPNADAADAVVPTSKGAIATTRSTTAAQIFVNGLPPSAISVEIQDLPVLGKALSGVYTKVDDDSTVSLPAVTIESPRDKVAAIKAIASTGHLEFDIDGVLKTHLDVDVATDSAGSATIRVASPIIPALPFQNSASY